MLAAIALKRLGERRDLARAAGRRARREVAGGELGRRVADAADRLRDPAGEQQPATDRGGRRAGRDREHLAVGAHVEHHPAGGEHRGERHADRDEREPGELEPHGRRAAERVGDREADREARARDDDREDDHGSSR